MKILIYGKTGQVARCIALHASDFGFQAINFGREDAAIDDIDALYEIIATQEPDILVNAAAYNNVDGAEDDFQEALRVNAKGPEALAIAAKKANIPFIHISTDYVFDGNFSGFYSENDAPNPINKYGKSKLEGEKLVAKAYDNCVILRVSWVFSEFSNNFVKSMLRLANDRDRLSIVNDQFGIPTSAHHIAKAILTISNKLLEDKNQNYRGIFHFSSDEAVSRFEYVQAIFANAKELGITAPQLIPVSSEEFKTRAIRPISTKLDNQKSVRIFNLHETDWHDGLFGVLKKIAKNQD